mmetsp:Transcript_72174/g.200187  ORF Transcript_72174/g.200187 Transcript_72174/m.200187 type:complete len:257 (+) Transcript_72174:492-1262(+)
MVDDGKAAAISSSKHFSSFCNCRSTLVAASSGPVPAKLLSNSSARARNLFADLRNSRTTASRSSKSFADFHVLRATSMLPPCASKRCKACTKPKFGLILGRAAFASANASSKVLLQRIIIQPRQAAAERLMPEAQCTRTPWRGGSLETLSHEISSRIWSMAFTTCRRAFKKSASGWSSISTWTCEQQPGSIGFSRVATVTIREMLLMHKAGSRSAADREPTQSPATISLASKSSSACPLKAGTNHVAGTERCFRGR